jgi:RNA polymerase-interacting CarD/CdnL/TRCF family regulator
MIVATAHGIGRVTGTEEHHGTRLVAIRLANGRLLIPAERATEEVWPIMAAETVAEVFAILASPPRHRRISPLCMAALSGGSTLPNALRRELQSGDPLIVAALARDLTGRGRFPGPLRELWIKAVRSLAEEIAAATDAELAAVEDRVFAALGTSRDQKPPTLSDLRQARMQRRLASGSAASRRKT